eukprot:Sspe_Gene.6636::Locus_2238_Transcript_1_3_Confidence_0.429_Length_1678::g.6636::m.6636
MVPCGLPCAVPGCPGRCSGTGAEHRDHLCQRIHFCPETDEAGRRCRRVLLPSNLHHSGPHKFGHEACTVACPMCSRRCHKEYGHSGPHATKHGRVVNPEHLLEANDVEVVDPSTLSCPGFCSALGRGHVHLVPRGKGTRPSTSHMGLDEASHRDVFADWEDTVRDEVSLCRVQCTACGQFCTREAAHPQQRTESSAGDGQRETAGGHTLCCHHPLHVILLVDTSRSMAEPASPTGESKLCLALQCVGEVLRHRPEGDKHSIVGFSAKGAVVVAERRSGQDIPCEVGALRPAGGTKYSVGLEKIHKYLVEGEEAAIVIISDGKSTEASGHRSALHRVLASDAVKRLPTSVVVHGVKLGGSRHSTKLHGLTDLSGGIFLDAVTDPTHLTSLLVALDGVHDARDVESSTRRDSISSLGPLPVPSSLSELVDGEAAYVAGLAIVTELFAPVFLPSSPHRRPPAAPLPMTEEENKLVFGGVEEILDLHRPILSEIHT